MKLQNYPILASIVICLLNGVCFAQGGNPPPPMPPPPPGLPINEWIPILFFGAIAYGVYKILKRSKT